MVRFNRRVIVEAGPVRISNEDLEINGRVSFTEEWVDDVSRVIIENLTPGTVSSLSEQETITVQGGYEGDFGVILEGRIRSVSTDSTGENDTTTILIGSGVRDFQDAYVSESLLNRITPQEMVSQVLDRVDSVQLGNLDVSGEPYKSHTVARTAYNELDGLKRDFDRVAYLRDLQLFFEDPDENYAGREVTLRPDGVLNSIKRGYSRERDEEAVIVEAQLSQSLFTGATINVQNTDLEGTYRVVSGGHSLTKHVTDVVGVEV